MTKNNETRARSLNYAEPVDPSLTLLTYKSDNSDAPMAADARAVSAAGANAAVAMPMYYSKSANLAAANAVNALDQTRAPHGLNGAPHGLNDTPKAYNDSNPPLFNQLYPGVPVSRRHHAGDVPYLSVSARSTPVPPELHLTSFKPHDYDNSRPHTPSHHVGQRSRPDLMPQLPIMSGQSSPGSDGAYLANPDLTHFKDLRRLSPRSQRYLDKPLSRPPVTGNPHAMAPLPEHVAFGSVAVPVLTTQCCRHRPQTVV